MLHRWGNKTVINLKDQKDKSSRVSQSSSIKNIAQLKETITIALKKLNE